MIKKWWTQYLLILILTGVLEPIPHGCRGMTVISKLKAHFKENTAMQKYWKEMGGEVGGHFRQFYAKVRLGKRQKRG